MKRLSVILSLIVILSIGLIGFKSIRLGGIIGRITPQDGASSVSIVAGTDTVKAQINQGAFGFTNLKQGVYTIWIKGNAPYKDSIIENVAVKDSATTDLGEIKLLQ